MKNVFFFTFTLFFFNAFAQTYTVGTQTITYTDAARSNRSVGVEFRYPGTNAAVASGQFPFVIFAHGFQMDQVPYYPYADSLAKQGYIVGLLTTETSLSPSHANFAQDLIFVYNKLISESNTNTASPFYQKVIAKGAIGGHSMGGGSTVLSCQYSNPATCYFTFAAATTNPSSISAAPSMTKPYLSFAGSRDCIAPIATNQQPMYDSSGSGCKFLINITDALHCQFGSGNFQCNLGEGVSLCASSPLSRAAQINKTLFYLVPYLNYYLKGDCSAWTLFESRYASNTTDVLQRNCTNNIPSNPFISGNNYFCNGSSATLTAHPTSFSYEWNDHSTADTLSVSAAGNYSVVVGNGVCSLPSVSVSVSESFPPSLSGIISGMDTICFAQDPFLPSFSVNTNANALNYTWTLPFGWSFISSSNDSVITVNADSSGIISVFVSNTCGNSDTLYKQVRIGHSGFVQIIQNGDTLTAPPAAGYQWYLGGTAINGAISQSYVPIQSGDYSVIITNDPGCNSFSNTITFIHTAVNDLAEEGFLSIYPNPNSTGSMEFRINKDWLGAEMKIFDIEGREVLKSSASALMAEKDISALLKGVYIASIEKNGRKHRKMVVIE